MFFVYRVTKCKIEVYTKGWCVNIWDIIILKKKKTFENARVMLLELFNQVTLINHEQTKGAWQFSISHVDWLWEGDAAIAMDVGSIMLKKSV